MATIDWWASSQGLRVIFALSVTIAAAVDRIVLTKATQLKNGGSIFSHRPRPAHGSASALAQAYSHR